MRISDVMNLKWENIESNRLVYTMQKTKLHCSLAIYDKAQEILDLYKKDNCVPSDYIFPIMTVYENKRKKKNLTLKDLSDMRKARTTNINHHLKILVKKAEIEKNVSFHMGRHIVLFFQLKTSKLQSGFSRQVTI